MDAAAALDRYSRYLAEATPTDPSIRIVTHGPLRCWLGPGTSCYENAAVYSGEPEGVADAIEQASQCFEGRDYEFKLTAWNMPAETPAWLEARGFAPGEPEQVLALDVPVLVPPAVREGLKLIELVSEADMGRLVTLQQGIWENEDFSWLGEGLWREKQTDAASIELFGIEEGSNLVAAAWMRLYGEIAFFHGGATLPAWRGKGLYRELVNARLRRCQDLKLRWAFTEAVPASLPILQKLGFEAIGATQPYFFRR